MLARPLTAACCLIPLLFSQPATLLTQTLRPSDPQRLLPGPTVSDEIPFVPWPQSLSLLEGIDGDRRVGTPLGAVEPPATWNGELALPYARGVNLLAAQLDGLTEIRRLVEELRALTLRATSAPGDDRTLLEMEARARLGVIERQTRFRRFGVLPLGEERNVYVFFLDLLHTPVAATAVDVSPDGLGLSELSYTATPPITWLDEIDTASDELRRHANAVALRLERLRAGGPSHGLQEIERLLIQVRDLALAASDGTLNTSDRVPLSGRSVQLAERIDEVARATDLDGGRVWLETSDPRGLSLLFDVPDIDVSELLGGDGSVETVSSASLLVASTAHALEVVSRHRHRVQTAELALLAADPGD